MSEQGLSLVFESGEWQIHLGRRELLASGVAVPIGARAFEIVEVLVRSANELVTKNDLMDRIWPGVTVGENTLQVHISAIRKAFGQDRAMLKTASGRGYRLIGNWTPRHHGSVMTPATSEPTREPVPPPTNAFPMGAGHLIGRTAATRHVRDLVSAYRVVTLTGTGGIGKTTLAMEAARGVVADFEDGGWLVELASLSDPDLVPSMVASALGLRLSGETSPESVARAVGAKHLLLLLDNCEHVIDAVAKLTEQFVRLCPHATILVTSRELLRIDGEAVYRVPPLDVPAPGQETPDHIRGHSAVELFITRTNALNAQFSPRSEELTSVAAICRRLDGIPLAIEFAAASAATLGIEHVAMGLRDRLTLLTRGRRTALARQSTMRATLDWSHELLPEAEQRLFRHLAVFHGGFTLDAAVAVVTDTGLDARAVADGIANLVAKSLVAVDMTRSATRWRLLETIRAYALEKLGEHGEAGTVSGRHAAFFRDVIGSMAPPWGLGSRRSSGLDDCLREIGNTRAALDWAFSTDGDPEIGIALTAAHVPVWFGNSMIVECRDRTEHALRYLRPTTSPLLHMRLRLALGITFIVTSEFVGRSRQLLSEALRTAESLGDLDAELRGLWGLWTLCLNTGECYEANDLAERFFAVGSRSGDNAILPVAHRILGHSLYLRGNQIEARRHLECVFEPLDRRTRGFGSWFLYDEDIVARAMLARVMWLQGLSGQALGAAQTCMTEALAADNKLSLCLVLVLALIPIALDVGARATAERARTMLDETATRNSFRQYMSLGRYYEGVLLISRGEFPAGTALLKAALEKDGGGRGGSYSYPTLVALANGLSELGQPEQARSTIDRALDGVEREGQSWCLAELLRTKGELLIRQGGESFSSAETLFQDALELARQQGALFWELRIALSIARLRTSQGRRHEAKALLAPVYDRFTEGFTTADLRAARIMLGLLPT